MKKIIYSIDFSLLQKKLLLSVLVIFFCANLTIICSTNIDTVTASSFSCVDKTVQQVDITIDNVNLHICTPFLPTGNFVTSAPGDALQGASSATFNPFKEFVIESYTFGMRTGGGTSKLKIEPGSDNEIKQRLETTRKQQKGSIEEGPSVSIFGKLVKSNLSHVKLDVDTKGSHNVQIVEWIIENGKRLWIFRISVEENVSNINQQQLLESLAKLDVSSNNPDTPTTITTENQKVTTPLPTPVIRSAVDDLPQAPWWKDNNSNYSDCDDYHYYANSGWHSYRLGGVYRNVPACGPRPIYDNAPDVVVQLPGFGEYEWECVELSMRFLNLAYGTLAYNSPGGKDVVNNYPGTSGTTLNKVANGTVGQAPQAGDIISFGATSGNSFGHTAVVIASAVDGGGNGSITIMEQNNSASGSRSLNVTNWVVANATTPYGWLHLPNSSIAVGQGSSRQQNFVDAYNRAGGQASFGSPTNTAHFWDLAVVIQDFRAPNGAGNAILHDEGGEVNSGVSNGVCRAYYMLSGIFAWYASNGAINAYGPPTADEYSYNGAARQSFNNGYISWLSPPTFTAWPTSGTGWRKEFYNNTWLACGKSWVEYEPNLTFDYNWGDTATPHPAVLRTNNSARLTRTERFTGGNYTFTVGSDDGVRLWVDNNLIIDQWVIRGYTENSWAGNLTAGDHQLKIEYFQQDGGARLKFNVSPTYSVGQGSGFAQLFIDTVNRVGGVTATGNPKDIARWFNDNPTLGVVWQPLGGSVDVYSPSAVWHQQAAYPTDPTKMRAFWINGSIYDYYLSVGGPTSSLGVPTSEISKGPDNLYRASFANGYVGWNGTAYQTYLWPTSFSNWKATYFNNKVLAGGPALVRNEGTAGSLNFNYSWPAYTPPIPEYGVMFADSWSAKWERTYSFTPGNIYTFKLCGDDGVRLYLNGALVIDQWKVQSVTCYQYQTNYATTTSVALRIEYYQEVGGQIISFEVTSTPIAIGQGSGYQQNYVAANTRFGSSGAGQPTDIVKFYPNNTNGITWQPLTGGPAGTAAIFHHEAGYSNPTEVRAYAFGGGIYNYYMSLGGPNSWLGTPTSDGFQTGVGTWQVNFAGGYISDQNGTYSATAWPTTGTGWRVEMYNNKYLASGVSRVFYANTSNLDYDWGSASPYLGIFTDYWSARFTKTINFAGGNYTFQLNTDDGVRLWIDNVLVYNDWNNPVYTPKSWTGNLTAGNHQVKLEYFDATGGAWLHLAINQNLVSNFVVTNPIDTGSTTMSGTLSYALANATSGQIITFNLSSGNTISIKGALPTVKAGVILQASCANPVIIDGSDPSASNNGLILQGTATLQGLKLQGFRGKALEINGSKGNRFICTSVRKN